MKKEVGTLLFYRGKLTPEQVEKAEAHLASCAICTAEYDRMTDAMVHDALHPEEIDDTAD